MASAVLKACYLVFLVNQRLLAETANFTPKFLYFHLHYSDSNLLMIIDPPESTQPARTNTSLDHLQDNLLVGSRLDGLVVRRTTNVVTITSEVRLLRWLLLRVALHVMKTRR